VAARLLQANSTAQIAERLVVSRRPSSSWA
jgi:hypothetical protein